jgi:ABC-type polysaccharide transport system permease subunit
MQMIEDKALRRRAMLLRIIQIILAVLAVASMALPYIQYKYLSKTYTLSGFSLLSGGEICGGTVEYAPITVAWILLIVMVVALVAALLSFKVKPVVCAEILTVGSIVGIFVSFYLLTHANNILHDAKNVSGGIGAIVAVIASIALIVTGLMQLKDHKILCALDFMVMPGMIYLLINNYIPMFGIYIAFKKVDYSLGLWESPWVGLENFKYLFSTKDAFIITRNTLLYNAAFIVLGILTGIIVGIALSELFKKVFQKFYQTMILLPQLISMVIVSYIVFGFLSNETGLINHLLNTDINFYASPQYWPFILIFIYIWKQLGYNAIIFLSSIVGIDQSLYEAARVDGATKWQQITKITLPQLKPTIITLFLLSVGRIFYSDFGLFYQVPLDAGALYNVTNTVDTYVYRALLVNNNISTASAASTYQAILGFIVVFVVNMIIRKADKENAMF